MEIGVSSYLIIAVLKLCQAICHFLYFCVLLLNHEVLRVGEVSL